MIFRSPYPDLQIPKVPLTQVMLRHAVRLADKPAFIDGSTGAALTYRELAENIEQAAAGLAARGLRKGDVAAILSPNAPHYAVAFMPWRCSGESAPPSIRSTPPTRSGINSRIRARST